VGVIVSFAAQSYFFWSSWPFSSIKTGLPFTPRMRNPVYLGQSSRHSRLARRTYIGVNLSQSAKLRGKNRWARQNGRQMAGLREYGVGEIKTTHLPLPWRRMCARLRSQLAHRECSLRWPDAQTKEHRIVPSSGSMTGSRPRVHFQTPRAWESLFCQCPPLLRGFSNGFYSCVTEFLSGTPLCWRRSRLAEDRGSTLVISGSFNSSRSMRFSAASSGMVGSSPRGAFPEPVLAGTYRGASRASGWLAD